MSRSSDRGVGKSARVTAINALGQLASFSLFAVIAFLYGATEITDAFFLALAVPALIIGPVVNSIHSVAVPMITASRIRTPEEAPRLAGAALGWLSVLGVVATLLLVVLAPFVVELLGLPLALRTSVVRQTWILAPLVALQVVSGILHAILNADGSFERPALAFAARHASVLVALLSLRPLLGELAIAVAFVLGAFVQFILLAAQLRGASFRVRPSLAVDASLRQSIAQATPLVGSSVVLQGGSFALRAFASGLAPGSVTMIDYASRIAGAVVELVGSGVLVVSMVNWSELVARNETARVREAVRRLVGLSVIVLVPIAVLFGALSPDVVAITLGRGQMSQQSLALTAAVLAFYSLTIPVEIVGRLYLRLFLAWHETRALAAVALARLGTLVVVAFALRGAFGVRGLAAAELASLVAYVAVLGALAGRHLCAGAGVPWPLVGRATLGGALMWGVAVLVRAQVSTLPALLAAGLSAGVALIAYGGLAALTGDAAPLIARFRLGTVPPAERP